MNVFSYFNTRLKKFRTSFWVLFFMSVIDGAGIFLIPAVLAEFTKTELTPEKTTTLILTLIGLYASMLVFQWFLRKYGESLAQKSSNEIRLQYFSALERMPIAKLSEHHSGYALSLINRVADSANLFLIDLLWMVARTISVIGLFFYFTARTSVPAALANVGILVVFMTISLLLSRRMMQLQSDLNKNRATLMELFVDFMTNIVTIKRLGIRSFASEHLERQSQSNDELIQKTQNFHANRWLVLHFIFGVSLVGTLSYLVINIQHGNLSASTLILFAGAFSLVKHNVDRIAESIKSLMALTAYVNNLNELVPISTSHEGGEYPDRWKSITLRDTQFNYPEHSSTISIPDFQIAKGEIVCIFGESGQGKSTFLNLTANLLNPTSGERLIDKKPYKKISRRWFTEKTVYISQEVELFNLSLRANITLDGDVGEREINQALKELGLFEWVHSLEKGLDTLVGEKGVKLSAGQKQRINLLRGILLDRDIYLLDEPTSHLDAETEKRVIDFLKTRLQDKTAIIVSHRESIREICDRAYLMHGHELRLT